MTAETCADCGELVPPLGMVIHRRAWHAHPDDRDDTDGRDWLADQTADDTVHTVPLGDLIQHQPTDECPCGPTTKPAEMPEGRIGWIITHHSLDGRELEEQP